ncbi:hypothetical protein WMY93_029402 [Mugilogobius chulae]|uniref:Uncharacterized protein n=1 Tax=Mugilogobius chulae TaxID=88201 RepID=A0AAW0MXW5_9GOBI
MPIVMRAHVSSTSGARRVWGKQCEEEEVGVAGVGAKMCGSLHQRLQDYLSERRSNRTRLVTKDGRCNIEYGNIKYSKHLSFLADFWTTVVEISLIWYWIARDNGDLTWQNPSEDHSPCVDNVVGLTTAFLYSLETQTTIGYGGRAITPTCPGAVAVIIIQSLIGAIINCFIDMAVICPKNGALCLSIRVANLRKSLMIGSNIYGKLLRTRNTADGETIIMDQVNIDFMMDAGKDNLFFVTPLTLYHVIDKSSPFFEMAVDTLHKQEFELVVFLDGTAESTSSSCQVRTSFIPQEIMWGYNYLPIISRSKEGKYRVDFSNFSKVVPVATAHCPYCFHNIKGHHHFAKTGHDNPGFEVIDLSEHPSVTKL